MYQFLSEKGITTESVSRVIIVSVVSVIEPK
jgi:hypothetical protein